MKLFSNLWAKISFGVVMMIIIIMSSVTYVLTLRQVKDERTELRQNMGRMAKLIASIRFAETRGWYVYQDWIDNIVASELNKDIVYIAIFNERDSLAAFALNTTWLEMGDSNYLTRTEQAEVVQMLSYGQIANESQKDFDHQVVDIKWGDERLGRVDVGFSLINFNDAIRRRLLTNLILLALFSLLGVFGSVMMSHRITRPLNDLSEAMKAIAKGNLDQHLETRRKDEIGQLASSFNEMLKGLKEKTIIEKFSRDLSFTFEADKIAKLFLDQVFSAMPAGEGAIFVVDKTESEITATCLVPNAGGDDHLPPFALSIETYDTILNMSKPGPVANIMKQKDFARLVSQVEKIFKEAPGIISPLKIKDNLFGFVLLGAGEKGEVLSQRDLDLLATLSTQASLSMENAKLLSQLTEQEKIKKELEIARSVQARLLPTKTPEINGLEIVGTCIPADEVGGDYFDYFLLDDRRLGIAIADVSGKGISAAFYMAEIKGMMSSLATLLDSPAKLLRIINQRLYESMDRRMFATMIYGVLDVEKRTLTFVRAGHNPLILHRKTDNDVSFLIPSGLGVGLTRNEVFCENLVEQTITLSPGDLLVFFTDGITESMTNEQQEFGEERLAELISNRDHQSVAALQQQILQTVRGFAKDAPQHDDMTFVLARLL